MGYRKPKKLKLKPELEEAERIDVKNFVKGKVPLIMHSKGRRIAFLLEEKVSQFLVNTLAKMWGWQVKWEKNREVRIQANTMPDAAMDPVREVPNLQ